MKFHLVFCLGLFLAAPAFADLGTGNTISTIHGKTYRGVVILDMQPDGFTFTHSNGSGRMLFADLPADLRKELGYDEKKAAAFEKARAEKKQKEKELLIERQTAAAQAHALARTAELQRLAVLEQQYAVALNQQYAAAAATGFGYPVLAPAVGLQRGLHQTYLIPRQQPRETIIVKQPDRDDGTDRPGNDRPDHRKAAGPDREKGMHQEKGPHQGQGGPGGPKHSGPEHEQIRRGEPVAFYPIGGHPAPVSQIAVHHQPGQWVLIDKGVSSRPFRFRDGVEFRAGSSTAVHKHPSAGLMLKPGIHTAPLARSANGVPALGSFAVPALGSAPAPARAPAAPAARGHAARVAMPAAR